MGKVLSVVRAAVLGLWGLVGHDGLSAAVAHGQAVPPGYGDPSGAGAPPILIVPYYGPSPVQAVQAPYGPAPRPLSEADRHALTRSLRCERIGALLPLAGLGLIFGGLVITDRTIGDPGTSRVHDGLIASGVLVGWGGLLAGDVCALRTSRLLHRSGRRGRRGLSITSFVLSFGLPYVAPITLSLHQRRVRADLAAEGILPARGRLRPVAAAPWFDPSSGVVGTVVVGAF